LLDSESGKYISSSSHRILKDRKWLIITPLKHELSEHILIEPHQKAVSFSEGVLHFVEKNLASIQLNTEASMVQLDAAHIEYPLILRKWKQGDYFYPLGLSGKKKLSRFFIDKNLSLADKEKVWVLEMNKKIIWVVGLRLDDRFKLRDSSRQILEIKHSSY
jgi:tRNA(Ile)-lysidine synthase